jgi:hypothetical protein
MKINNINRTSKELTSKLMKNYNIALLLKLDFFK